MSLFLDSTDAEWRRAFRSALARKGVHVNTQEDAREFVATAECWAKDEGFAAPLGQHEAVWDVILKGTYSQLPDFVRRYIAAVIGIAVLRLKGAEKMAA